MEIIEKSINEVHPYGRNPRKNDEAVEYVANSIREFGFKVPMVIKQDGEIVCGHTRYKAAQKLGLQTVPCVIADDLTEEQIQAFRLADNKVGEVAEWDADLLMSELQEITELDMTQFAFDMSVFAGGDSEPEEDGGEYDDIEKMEKHYGVPYQGNKSRIADIIINLLPEGERLVDLFGGGGAITHCAMLSGKWHSYLYNDLNEMITGLFIDAVYGKYHDERRVITRQEFEDLKNTDAYVAYCWSFGNSPAKGYLWGEEYEEIKCTACHALIDEDLQERRLAYVHLIKLLQEKDIAHPELLQPLQYLQALTRLEALQRLEDLQRLEVSNISYEQYEHRDGDVVYCDVPYEVLGKEKCSDYGVQFDSLAFYKWAKEQPYQIFFSSYEISDQTFHKKKIKAVASLIGANTNGQKVNEYLYSNRPFED